MNQKQFHTFRFFIILCQQRGLYTLHTLHRLVLNCSSFVLYVIRIQNM